MSFFRDLSINRKLKVIIMAACGIVLFLTSAAVITYEMVMFRGDTLRSLTILAEVIGTNSTASLSFEDREAAAEALAALRADRHIVGACTFDANGEIFAVYSRDGSPDQFTPPAGLTDSEEISGGAIHLFRPIIFQDEKGRLEFAIEKLANPIDERSAEAYPLYHEECRQANDRP